MFVSTCIKRDTLSNERFRLSTDAKALARSSIDDRYIPRQDAARGNVQLRINRRFICFIPESASFLRAALDEPALNPARLRKIARSKRTREKRKLAAVSRDLRRA